MFPILLFLFTIIPAIEIYLLFSIGGQIGGLNTLLVVIITGFVGAALAKSQGMQILHKIQSDLQRGSVPTNQFLNALLVFGGGLLLLTPGFITDIMGLLMVFAPTRFIISQLLKKYFESAIASGNVQFYSFNGQNKSYQSETKPHVHQVGPDTFEADYKKK